MAILFYRRGCGSTLGRAAVYKGCRCHLHSSGIPFDVALGALPFEENSVRRASFWRTEIGGELLTCSAEHFIVHKSFAARDLDWSDVTRVAMRQGRKLNIGQIWTELRPLVALKEQPEILVRLQELFDRYLD